MRLPARPLAPSLSRKGRGGPGASRAKAPAHAATACAAPSRSSLARSSPSGAWVAATIRPPPARCSRMTSANSALRRDVERGGRLVEQPERAGRDEQPRERDAALLAGRQRAHRKIGDMGEAEPRQRRQPGRAARIAAQHARPEGEILACRKRALQRVGMAEVMRLLAEALLGIAAFERELSLAQAQEIRRWRAAGSTCPRRSGRRRSALRRRRSPAKARRTTGVRPRSRAILLALRRMGLPSRRPSKSRRPTIVCVAAQREFIYKPVIPTPHTISWSRRMASLDSFKCRKKLTVGAKTYEYFSLKAAEKNGLEGICETAVLDEDRAREPAAQRGRPHRQEGGHRGRRGLARRTAARPSTRSPSARRAC